MAKSASRNILSNHYKELSTILTNNNLHDKPERIYNLDETGISQEYKPPKIVCDKGTNPQCVRSPGGSTITIIAGGNAVGNSIPPYFIFSGKCWNDDILIGAVPGSDGEMSKMVCQRPLYFRTI